MRIYTVEITKKDDVLTGKIAVEKTINKISEETTLTAIVTTTFSPINIFGDLPDKNNRQFFGDEYEFDFLTDIYDDIRNDWITQQILAMLDDIIIMEQGLKQYKLTEFLNNLKRFIKRFGDETNINCSPIIKYDNSFSYFQKKKGGCEHIDFNSIDSMFTNNTYLYSCKNVSELVFSIFHYLVSNEYKFTACKHCGKSFATRNLKFEYCTRNSPFEAYERFDCHTACKDIKKKFRRHQEEIDKNINKRINNGMITYDMYDKFTTGWENLDIENCYSVKCLKEIEEFLDFENRESKWYCEK
jgi:hypothetical protein